ncbi:hypothetical protein ONS95_012838 [Cadophora gregata]|uniref:uncharacterized protein n=1 Tax=Cadophora gregata TaxID=51156 RepID=UPI0026DC4FF6|nr:uncharacterized protein ONS95_012838 [Cadophora gregata]KAK0101181.1 hypothetical protein ONS96_006403 [Cadophora gregata f. sp. sojae]KAK0115786.1 hypothetical protein ONS95_012838 [Cadophora gregata]
MASSPMAWLLERAATSPAKAGKPITEFEIWAAVEDNQRAVKVERSDAPVHVQQYLAERRTFIDFWGTDELHLFPGPRVVPSIELSTATPPPSILPAARGLFLSSSAPGVSPVHNPTINGPALRRQPVIPTVTKERGRGLERGNAYRERSRSRSPRRRGDLYPPRDWDRLPRSRSPRWESRIDHRLESLERGHDSYPRRDSRYRSPSPVEPRRKRRPSPPAQSMPGSWQALAEKAVPSHPAAAIHRYTFPATEIRPSTQDGVKALNTGAVPKAHIDLRTQKPYPPLEFTDSRAKDKLLGKSRQALAEICRFFPAVVFQLEEKPKAPKNPATLRLWLEVKSSSDPTNEGVRWQIDACRRGFEAYHKWDQMGLPCVKDYYYTNRRLFHHGNTLQGRIMQGLGKPRDDQDLKRRSGKK